MTKRYTTLLALGVVLSLPLTGSAGAKEIEGVVITPVMVAQASGLCGLRTG